MSDELFTIRAAGEGDLPAINMMADAEGMGNVEPTDTVFVAVNNEDQVVAFIRLVFDNERGCHVNPVVVFPTWRRYGVGKALTEYALDRFGELRLVSRGQSLAFYQAQGFEEVPWDMICASVASECEGCEMREECHPTPLRKVK
ncbi:MAG: GNAT family N-acetyltransferase [Eggerthellaceae bacterium]|nr:GNAT family N-acetyltransferase [Eggerthellaceae bacterium]